MILTRTAVAERLGLTYAGVVYLEKRGLIHRRFGTIGKGQVTFDSREIEEYAKRHGKVRKPTCEPDGEDVARVFELLGQGISLVDVVIRAKLHPDIVEAIARRFEAMKNDADLEGSASSVCVKCKASPARFCGSCVH